MSGILDLERDGPTVVEIPPGCGPTTVNDAWFRFVTDMGKPGPDRGQGGKYLIVPPGYDGRVPDGLLRVGVAVADQLADPARPARRRQARRADRELPRGPAGLPAVQADDPPAMEFISMSGKAFNTIHANDVTFYDELDAVIQREPLGVIDPEIRGLLASIGIIKGTPFAPDERMRALLTEAATVANGTARAISFKTRDPEAYQYPDSAWKTGFVGNDYRWLIDDGVGGRNLDARTLFFYVATVNTPAMALHIPGVGSQYAYTEHDSHGEYLDGAQALPAHHPARRARQGLLVGRRSTTRRPGPSSRPASRSRARTTPATRSPPTTTARSRSPSGRPRPTTNRATGSRPSPARTGSRSCASTARSSPGSTRPGSPARSSPRPDGRGVVLRSCCRARRNGMVQRPDGHTTRSHP